MSSAEDSNVDPELRGMDVHRAYRPSSSGPEVLPLGDSAFRLPDHLPAQPPHRASVESSPAAEGQPWAEKTKKNGQGPARLKKACDACSKRKIKCDESGPPCKRCSEIDIPCTYARPSRRRGPRNRHADAIKQQLAAAGGAIHNRSGPASTTYAAQTLASLAQQPVLSADSICPHPLLGRLVDDYFVYVHPLVPFPHEPSFRAALAARADVNNPTFLALLASMIGYLVASVPRRPRLHVQDLGMGALFPDSDVLIDRCRRTIIEARGLGHLDRQQTVDDAIIAYFQGMIGAYNFDWDTCRLYLGQCVSIVRVIGSYRQDGPGRPPPPNIDGPPRNIVLQETSRRLFWALFSTVSSLQHLGVSARDISIPPPTKREPYPDLPIEADDIYITPQIVCSMPQGELSRLTGFNAIVKLYQACAEVSATEVAHGVDEVFDWASQSATISRSLDTVGVALRSLPPDLTFSPGSSSTAQPQPQQPDCPPPTLGYPNMNDSQMAMQVDDPNNERRKVQLEIQKLNIVATEIATRLTLIEKYSRLSDTVHGSDRTGHDYADETKESRDETIKGFVKMIRALDLMYLEPAGLGFTNKLRQVASTLATTSTHRKSDYHQHVERHVLKLVDHLHETQRVGPKGAEGVNEENLMAEQWATELQSIEAHI